MDKLLLHNPMDLRNPCRAVVFFIEYSYNFGFNCMRVGLDTFPKCHAYLLWPILVSHENGRVTIILLWKWRLWTAFPKASFHVKRILWEKHWLIARPDNRKWFPKEDKRTLPHFVDVLPLRYLTSQLLGRMPWIALVDLSLVVLSTVVHCVRAIWWWLWHCGDPQARNPIRFNL